MSQVLTQRGFSVASGAVRPSVAQTVYAFVATGVRRLHQRMDLAALDDRMLNDIGMSKAEQLRESSKPFWVA